MTYLCKYTNALLCAQTLLPLAAQTLLPLHSASSSLRSIDQTLLFKYIALQECIASHRSVVLFVKFPMYDRQNIANNK